LTWRRKIPSRRRRRKKEEAEEETRRLKPSHGNLTGG
jgi:hypothetical protein